MKNINMNLRKLRLFSAAVCLARFAQPQVAEEYLQSRKEEVIGR